MIFKLLQDFSPNLIAVTFDYGKETFRNKTVKVINLIEVHSDDLIPQFDLIKFSTKS